METYQQLLIALRRINKATDMAAKRLARDTGLTTPQLMIMQQICERDGMTVGELAQAINLTQATTTSIVTGLERKQLLTKRRDIGDKRRVIVTARAAGRKLLQRAPRSLQDDVQRRFEQLADWEQSAMLAGVQHLAALMDAADIDAAPVLHTGAIERAGETPAEVVSSPLPNLRAEK